MEWMGSIQPPSVLDEPASVTSLSAAATTSLVSRAIAAAADAEIGLSQGLFKTTLRSVVSPGWIGNPPTDGVMLCVVVDVTFLPLPPDFPFFDLGPGARGNSPAST